MEKRITGAQVLALGELTRDRSGSGFGEGSLFDRWRAMMDDLCSQGFAQSFRYGNAVRYRITHAGCAELHRLANAAEVEIARALGDAHQLEREVEEIEKEVSRGTNRTQGKEMMKFARGCANSIDFALDRQKRADELHRWADAGRELLKDRMD